MAIRRAGRFDLRIPVPPPNAEAQAAIMKRSVPAKASRVLRGAADIYWVSLGREAILFTPADLRAVVESAIRVAIAGGGRRHSLDTSARALDHIRRRPRDRAALTAHPVRGLLERLPAEGSCP